MTLSFPTTPEAFTAAQARITGKPMDANIQEAVGAWVPIFNDCFQFGRRGDRAAMDTLVGRLAELDTLVGRLDGLNPSTERLTRFLKAARAWMIYAWQRGKQSQREQRAKPEHLGGGPL